MRWNRLCLCLCVRYSRAHGVPDDYFLRNLAMDMLDTITLRGIPGHMTPKQDDDPTV